MSSKNNSTNSTNSDSTNSTNSNSTNSNSDYIDWTEFIIKDRYMILKKIGKGSYCKVFLSYDIQLKKFIALKIYNEEDTEDAQNEILVLNQIKKLNLSNVILYNETFNYEYDDNIYIIQTIDLCGYSLNYIIKLFKDDFKDDNILYQKYINFIYNSYLKLNNILIELHLNEYSHTDIKPENILIDLPILENTLYLDKIKKIHNELNTIKKKKNINTILQNECKKIINQNEISENDIKQYLKEFNYSIKLSDFGTALKIGDDTIYKKHTQYYKSPKILLKYPLDYTYDFWSLGCTLFELLTMEILFDPYSSDIEDLFNTSDDRNLMYLIVSTLGIPDKNILLKSLESDIYFNTTYNYCRGYNEIKFNNFIQKLYNNNNKIIYEDIKLKYNELINVIIKYINYSYLFNI
jgi:serine/threonine protein kinase